MAKDKLNVDEMLEKAFGPGKEKKMGKIKITVDFSDIGDDETLGTIRDIILTLDVNSENAERYIKNKGYVYLKASGEFADKVVTAFKDIPAVIVTVEEIPPTPKELLDQVIATEPEKFRGSKGYDGNDGAPGKDGKDAPWVAITICLAVGMVLLSLFFARVFRPDANDIVTGTVSNIITETGNKAIDGVSARAQGAIRNIEQAEKDAVAKLQGVTPPVTQIPPVTITPATGKTFEQQLQDAMNGK